MVGNSFSNMLLDGIRVVDWSTFQIGPAAAAALGDIGAEVIHVEPVRDAGGGRPETGGRGTSYALPGGRSARMEDLNRNKKSLAVDLATPEGQEIIHRLVAKSDVFITNFRRKAATKLGMDYETLCRYNPRLVYAGASAFGDAGPLKDAPGFAMTGAAHSGLMMSSGEEGSPPTVNSAGVPDRTTAIYLAFGIMAALFWRDRTGAGQEVSTSMLGCLIHAQSL
ncbi:MAG: CoA transferase, partial [Chloroflexi bacterium]|nr:CoA transferase [Chloroflexota bacterium]